MNPELVKLLVQHEGLRYKPYRCASGKLSIGVGRNLDDKGLSFEEIMYLLENDIAECWRDLEIIFENFGMLPETKKNALISMRFNLGSGGFRSFKKMIAAVNSGKWKEAAAQVLDSKYADQVPIRAHDIARMLRGQR